MRPGQSFSYASGIGLRLRDRHFDQSVVLAIVGWGFSFGATDARAEGGPWVTFIRQTATRIDAAPDVSTSDDQEKDYVWGDVDRDGDIDLICVRKIPFTHIGGRRNVLFLNENGVLVDRTADFATDADDGGQGFLDATNDRDVTLADVDGDGWLDMITATTLGDGLPKTISHPRIYMNKRNAGGNWLGFRYEQNRIPQLFTIPTNLPVAPRFCSVSAGDVTGDNRVDLYFGDYDGSGSGGEPPSPTTDLNDRLLINDGNGFFTDSGHARMTETMLESAFAMATVIADMNNDNVLDVVKDTALNTPQRVSVSYNDPGNEGFFDVLEIVYNNSPYHISVGDLNNDGRPDIVVTDDGDDRYLLNEGNGFDGLANFTSQTFSFESGGDDGFGGNSVIADLDGDGFNDVIITDVDVDDSVAGRRTHIYHNLGDVPNVTLEEPTGSVPWTPSAHDVAAFDLNGDGAVDLVFGTRTGMDVWINQPDVDFDFSYPDGIPSVVTPEEVSTLRVKITGTNGDPVQGSGKQYVSVGGGSFVPSNMTMVDSTTYQITLPAVSCPSEIRFYVSAESPTGVIATDPADAPISSYLTVASFGALVVVDEPFETDNPAWTVINGPSLTGGAWTRVDPTGTEFPPGSGVLAQPEDDFGGAPAETKCYVTEQFFGGGANSNDVDGGPTILISPPVDLSGSDGIVTYARWMFSASGTLDQLTTQVANNGSNWTTVDSTSGTNSKWEVHSFLVSEYVAPTDNIQVRFQVKDSPNDSVTEAAIDDFKIQKIICEICEGDEDCLDDLFCNGTEFCADGLCLSGLGPCEAICDESADSCVECIEDVHCQDGVFCNGVEQCIANECAPGPPPCEEGVPCQEDFESCGGCFTDADCDDGVFCNGRERCLGGTLCFVSPGDIPCSDQMCDERLGCIDCLTDADCGGASCCDFQCVQGGCGVVPQRRMGDPILGLTRGQRERFEAGRRRFNTSLTAEEGLGPIFNQNACGSCHKQVAVGGAGAEKVTRFGMSTKDVFDPLTELGGSLLQAQSISDECREVVPSEANIIARRVTPSIFGAGLVEAIPGEMLVALQDDPPGSVSGVAHMVSAFEDPNGAMLRVGRFGWKAQVATLLTFSADASLNEMGFTNRFLPVENSPNGDDAKLEACDTVPDPEDSPDEDGVEFIDRVTDFQRFLAPPPQTPRLGMSGEIIFARTGCTDCHIASFTTGTVGEEALSGVRVKPFSDFLLHDMGALGDGIVQGSAGATEIRTAALWGLRARDPLLHDGRASGGTFARRVTEAINWHGANGSEARSSAELFEALSPDEKAKLIAFLDTLGRAEFDHTGDNLVTRADFLQFLACARRDAPFDRDDVCSISDIDLDGDIDQLDFDLFLTAYDEKPLDCNDNGTNDLIDLFTGASSDVNGNAVPDACDPDCNDNGIPDDHDVATGKSADINVNAVPDECEPDCNENGVPDDFDISTLTSSDCQANGIPDECDIAAHTSADVNVDGVPDECNVCLGPADCRDGDVCTFDRCGANVCLNTVTAYGDVAGDAGSCGPNELIDLFDILAMLDAFQGIYVDDCEPSDLDISGVDQCLADGTIDLSDILGVLDAFAGTSPCCQ